MKRIQGEKIFGSINIQIEGDDPTLFLRICADHQISIWKIKNINDKHCMGTIFYFHVKKVKELANQYGYRISLGKRKGIYNYFQYLLNRKELIFATLFSFILLIILSNIAWKVEIIGVPKELEEKIATQLQINGLYEGAWTLNLIPLHILQNRIIENVPELLYIGIEKKGTTFIIQGEEKLIVPEEETKTAQHLVANKNGIIQKMFVKNGQALVQVNDYVEKGDMLVSGKIEAGDIINKDKEPINEIVRAEGEIYANTWYEVLLSTSLYPSRNKLSGEQTTKYYVQVFHFDLPIWGFGKIPYKNIVEETEKTSIVIMNWKIPIPLIKKTIYNQEKFSEIRTVEEAINIGINHTLDNIRWKLGKDTEILKYYVLHQSVENGKVKLILYISVLEDIAVGTPIH